MSNNKKDLRQRVDEKKAEQKRRKSLNFSTFLVDVKHNPMILIGLGGSAIFTSLAGIFLGIAPKRVEGEIILFGGDASTAAMVVGIFFALIYGVTFPLLGEWGLYYWHKKASLRDEGNTKQTIIGYGMFGLTMIFTAVTAVFAAGILATLVSAFTVYSEISPAAQHWTVTIIPIGLILHAFANIIYDHVSKAAEERREMQRELQAIEIESENRIQQALVTAREKAAIAYADEFEAVAESEAAQIGKKRAQEAWRMEKRNMGADEPDASHQPPANSHPAPTPVPVPVPSPNGKDPVTPNQPNP